MENTIIIKKDGIAINSKDCQSFHVNVRMVKKGISRDSGENPSSRPSISRETLTAQTFTDKIEVISEDFHSTDDACNALLSLLKAIGQEKVWDVREHNSDQESDQESSETFQRILP